MDKSILVIQAIFLVMAEVTKTAGSVPTTAVSAPPIPHRVHETNSTIILLKFTNEFIDLEKNYGPKNPNQLLKNYTSLLDKINSYTQQETLMNNQDRVILTHLNAALMSEICSINFRPDDVSQDLLLDLEVSLDSAIARIARYEEQEYVNASQESFSRYEVLFKQKIQENLNFMDRAIARDLDRTYQNVDSQVNGLISEVIDLNVTELRDKQSDLLKQLILRKLLGVVNFGSSVVTFLAQMGASAGAGVGWSRTISEVVSMDDLGSTSNYKLDKLPATIKSFLSSVKFDVEKIFRMFEDKLVFAKSELQKILNSTEVARQITQKIEGTQREMNQMTGPKTLKKFLRMFRFLVDKRQKLGDFVEKKVELVRKNDSLSLIDKGRFIGYMNKVLRIVNLVEIQFSTLQIFKKDSEKMKRFVAVERKIKNYVKSLDIFKARIAESLVKNLEEIEISFRSKKDGLANVSQWKVYETTQVIKRSIEDMTRGYSNNAMFLDDCIRRIDQGMNLMMDLYHRVHNYQDEVTLVTYIRDISQEVTTEDQNINFLKSVILSNVIKKHYISTLKMYKNYVFPLETIDLWFNNSAQEAIDEIFRLKKKLKSDASIVSKYDQYLHSDVHFHDSESIRYPPFYRWGPISLKRVLSDLLSGREVVLDADVTQALSPHNGIRFNTIDIRFKLVNATMQQKFDDALGKFQVLATHFGNSEYKCCHRFCGMSSPVQNLEFSVSKENDSPKDSNDIYKLHRNGKAMLSPYATWSFRLEVDRINSGFYMFNEFKSEQMSLELTGRGQYLKSCISEVCRNIDS